MLSKKLHNTKSATVRLQNKITVRPPGTLYGGGGHQSIFEERLLIWGHTNFDNHDYQALQKYRGQIGLHCRARHELAKWIRRCIASVRRVLLRWTIRTVMFECDFEASVSIMSLLLLRCFNFEWKSGTLPK
ncbi:unnamed protein product, partial [Nesidiocoris tenuis]